MKNLPTLECFFDGSCYPKNPYGAMGMGACINERGIELWKCSHTIPASKRNSNNVAEYLALEYILDELVKQGVKMETIMIKGDSKLVIEQMNGGYKIKKGMYVPAALRCKKKLMLLSSMNDIKFQWIPREQNSYCDALSGGDKFVKPGTAQSPLLEEIRNLPPVVSLANYQQQQKATAGLNELIDYCVLNNVSIAELIAAHKKSLEKPVNY